MDRRRQRHTDGLSVLSPVDVPPGHGHECTFFPDGQSVVYAAEWEGRPSGLYTARVDSIGEQPLSAEGEIEDISASGEVALLTDVQRIVTS